MRIHQEIQVGDWVIADDPTTPGEIEARQVLDTFVRETNALVDLYVDGEIISTTGEHPFWTPDKGWVEAKDLQVGDLLQTDQETFVDIDRIELREGKTTVYNFSVESFHTYFVSDLGILVHNTCFLTPDEFKQLPKGGTIDPTKIRFSQDSIDYHFKAPYNDTSVDDLAQKIREGSVQPDPIRIVEKDSKIYTLDNRRLYAHQQAGVPVKYQKLDHVPKRQQFKFTTKNDGSSIEVRNKP